MSNNIDRNDKATQSHGKRGGKAPRDRSRGKGFYLSLDAQMSLTQHLMCRGHSQRPPATVNVSLTIDSFHDVPFNARRLDKNVYHEVIDRDNILQVDPIYLSHPSARQTLNSKP
jgi:hypothetical protein